MNAYVDAIMTVAWLAIAGMLLWGVADGLRKVLWDDSRLPFFGMLERQGLTLARVEEVVGIRELSRAVRLCAHCAGRSDCGRRVIACPNEALFRRAKGLREEIGRAHV